MSRKIITTEETEEDKKIEGTLRPQYLKDYIGQEKIKSTLKVFIDAAKSRGEALDHVLFYGPPGLGKTTLCGIIANEMGVNLKVTSGPAIEKPGEMAAILNNLQEGDVLFVDEYPQVEPPGGGSPVSGDGRFCHRYHAWKGFIRPLDPTGSSEIYTCGSNNESGTFKQLRSGTVWCDPEAGILYIRRNSA